MSIRDPDRDLDDLMREDGGEIGSLYRRLPRYEPARRLDRAVLGEAARAVHSGKPPRRQRWIVGIGSAAGLVLAAGIAWRIGHDAMNPNDAASPASAPIVVPVKPISESERAKREAPEPQAAAPAETDAAQTRDSATAGAANRAAQDELKPAVRKARANKSAAAPAAQPPPAPAPVASSPPEAFPGAGREREQGQFLEKSKAGSVAPATGGNAENAVAPAARGLSSPTLPSASVELRRDMQLSPEDWLAHIHQLIRQGRRQQASESLRLFVRAHPDWEIPDDLRRLLD